MILSCQNVHLTDVRLLAGFLILIGFLPYVDVLFLLYFICDVSSNYESSTVTSVEVRSSSHEGI